MPFSTKAVLLAALLLALPAQRAIADPKTVCTITVNSPDEKEIFKRNLPQDEFRFVELVERGRPDWLGAACQAGVRCDLLVISGHFDSGTEFYTDRLDVRESLPVDELERVSCSDSCPGLFSQLKEVYLFGCNTLNAEAMRSASAEIARSLVRSGHSPADAERLSRMLSERHGESNRDRMRQIFKDVPVIYGFSSKAPLGRSAGPMLDRYFQSGAGGDIGSGRVSAKLLSLFAPSSMTVTTGMSDSDPRAGFRSDACRFADDRLSPAQRVGFVHELLDREMPEARLFLDRIEKTTASLTDAQRKAPDVAAALSDIARDTPARSRFLDVARDADDPGIRARMLELAGGLGWLSPTEQRAEFMQMFDEQLARNGVGSAEVDLACSLSKGHELGKELNRLQLSPASAGKVANAAMMACLGSPEGRARVLRALTSPSAEDVEIARIYLRYRPIADPGELRIVAAGITRMSAGDAQARALEMLAGQPLSDRESIEELTRLFPLTKSVNVQRAIAGILIRSDYSAIAKPDLVRTLREHRLKSPDGEDMIDVLIRRLQLAQPT